MKVKIKRIDNRAQIPQYSTKGSSGFDFYCLYDTVLTPNTWKIIQTGLAMEIPPGYEIQIRSRSGAAMEHGLIILNQPGTIDSDYRGPIGLITWNITNRTYTIEGGTRIAQGVLCPVVEAEFEEVDILTDSLRAEGGFGSTGTT